MRVTNTWLVDYQAKHGRDGKNRTKKRSPDAAYSPALAATDFMEVAARRGHSSDLLTGLCLNVNNIGKKSRTEWEEMEQQMFLLYVEMFFPRVMEVTTAVPLGGLRPSGIGGSLKGTGVREGFPDILIDEPHRGFHGLRIEMKRISKSALPSAEQIRWCKALAERGYATAVCWGHIAAIHYLHQYLEADNIFINLRYDYNHTVDYSNVCHYQDEGQK
ncbi:VRR-NUC domain-containing protein [Reinekea sp. G2M2-21]|uniref:VRR-NUC domain-containing protein n=1 Tax=Reinekea sp. G2M2-21 TaxID=2788942 RepID=UPI0018A8CC4B|nr:VRR-NUC domain-containing protein [Reinekea sp. G2M2-21]